MLSGMSYKTVLIEMGEDKSIVEDLEDVLTSIREMMRCDVLEEPFTRETIIGLNHEELREHSHYPMKYYKVKQIAYLIAILPVLVHLDHNAIKFLGQAAIIFFIQTNIKLSFFR